MSGVPRLMLAVAESTLRSPSVWCGYSSFVGFTAFVMALAICGTRTAADLEGTTGDVLRAWTTPGAALGMIAATILLGSLAESTHRRLDAERRSWWALGVLPWQGRLGICTQTIVVGGGAVAAGVALAFGAVRLVGRLPIDGVDVELRFDAIVIVATGVVVVLIAAPSTIRAATRFAVLGDTKARRWARLPLDLAWTVGAGVLVVTVSWGQLDSAEQIARVLPAAIGLMMTTTIIAVRVGLPAALVVLGFLDRCVTRLRWGGFRLALRSSRDLLDTSVGSVAPTVVACALSGGLVGILLAGDAVLRAHGDLGVDEQTVNVVGVLGLLVAPTALALAASVGACLIGSAGRVQRTRVLIDLGMTKMGLTCAAVLEAIAVWGCAVVPGAGASSFAIAALLHSGGVPACAWPAVIVNRELVAVAAAAAVTLIVCISAVQMVASVRATGGRRRQAGRAAR